MYLLDPICLLKPHNDVLFYIVLQLHQQILLPDLNETRIFFEER
jgi:hypothetical protein